MTDLKEHVSARGSATSLLAGRFSKHPERYVEIFRVLRKYKLHHVVAEVHRAVLRDGSEVAVKVQRPGVRQRIEIDLEVLREIARFAVRHTALGARYGLVQMVHELEMSLNQELDFRLEAENTRRIGRQIAGFGKLCPPTG